MTPLTGVIKDFIAVAVYIVVIAVSTSPLICALLVVLSLAATFSPRIYKKRLQEAGKKYVDEAADYTKHTQDLLSGFDMIDVKTKNSFSTANRIFTDRLSEKRRLMGHAKVNGNTISGGAVCIIGVVIFFVCGYLMLEGDITAGTVLAALSYVEVFSDPLEDILYGVNMLHSTKDVVKSLDEFLNDEEAGEGDTTSIAMIVCRNIKVAFPTKELRYDLQFEKGNKYVLHGESGVGKSTLLQVMMGRISYTGDLLVNGKEQTISVDQCSYMSQQQHIFMEDFETNVTLFQAYPPLEEGYQEKLDTATPYERAKDELDCSCLSGGEQQIVKFCRMLAQRKELLLLDEPFSAMDRKNAELLIAILNELPATIILVTHDKDMKGLENWRVIEMS